MRLPNLLRLAIQPSGDDWGLGGIQIVEKESFSLNLVERLKKESPATAAAWLAGLPPGEVRTEQLLRTTAAWAGTDPSAAAAFFLNLPPGPDRCYAILNTALAWHRNAPQAARAWLDTLPDSPAKTRALTELRPPGKTP